MGVIQSATLAGATQSAAGAQVAVAPGNWSVSHTPAAATQASATKAAGSAGVRHVCTGMSFGFSQPAAVPVAFTGLVTLLDGGSVLWQQAIAVPATASQSVQINVTGLNLVGTAATSMIARFEAAGGAATQETAVLMGYSIS